MGTKELTVLEEVKLVPGLKDVPEDQLEWLVEKGDCVVYEIGDYLFQPGTCMDKLHIVLSGRLIIRIPQGNQLRMVGYIEEHEITGTLPYSRAKHAAGYGEALERSHVLSVPNDCFKEMIRDQHELTTVFVHEMSSRIRKFTKMQQQNEKMMSLGKLSAGLAHELNNPSSAVVRGARELKKHLTLIPDKFKDVIKIRVTDQQVDDVNDVIFGHIAKGITPMSMLQRSSLEDDIADWLDEQEIEDESGIMEAFSAFNFTTDELDQIADIIPPEHLAPVVNWAAQNLITEKLVQDIEEASRRINELVTSIKSYTHMDQAPDKKATNVHEGLHSTLNMLTHKLRKNKIDVVEEWDQSIPDPKIHVSEINQVWTNLIDNAIDAMEGSNQRQLTIKTSADSEYVKIIIQDSGSGIPADSIDNIFDPFYTTKEVGKGTGIGLDIVWQIVTQHKGTISVTSEPGNTQFKVLLPID